MDISNTRNRQTLRRPLFRQLHIIVGWMTFLMLISKQVRTAQALITSTATSTAASMAMARTRKGWIQGAGSCHRQCQQHQRCSSSMFPSFTFTQQPRPLSSYSYTSMSSMSMSSMSMSSSEDATTTATATAAPRPQEEEDTIFALSTGALSSQATAVAVVRITGPQSHSILQSLCNDGKIVPSPRKACVRTLYDPMDGTPLDQALVLVFNKPHSFTGEDVVELHCHGSRAVLQGVLGALSNMPPSNNNTNTNNNKARYAERGEFTSRAFANGKLDLLEVEALADLLTADTQKQRQQALRQLEGHLSQLYNNWRETLVSGLAHAEAVIDFGDDEILDDQHDDDDDGTGDFDAFKGQMNVWGAVGDKMALLEKQMEQHLADANRGELVREGVKIAIVGPPNAGKSSLFNTLAKRDAAIVSPIAGTTRDVLELTLDLAGVRCTLSDTAGVREGESTDDVIELEGMKRARNVARQANVVVAMADATNVDEGLSVLRDVMEDVNMFQSEEEEEEIENDKEELRLSSSPSLLEPNDVLFVMNKLDLRSAAENTSNSNNYVASGSDLVQKMDIGGTFEISCETSEGIDEFLEALTEKVLARVSAPREGNDTASSSNSSNNEGAMITRARHRQHVQDAVMALSRFQALSKQGYMAVDMAAEELRLAVSELGRITGAVDVEDVLDVLFSDFCIGK